MNNRIHQENDLQISSFPETRGIFQIWYVIILVLVVVTAWAYRPVIINLFKDWQSDDDYSAGQIVPIIALFLVWKERKRLVECGFRPFWPGILLVIFAQVIKTYGFLFIYESAERYSLVFMIAGLILTIAGWKVFKKAIWILSFLFLMVPFPGRIHNIISEPLKQAATGGSVFLLEAFGANISRQGNVVTLNHRAAMAVEEACSGLRMLTAFIIVAAFIAYMIKRSRTQKAILLFSSIPVAVICNILRLCITAVLFMLVSSQTAEKFFHDFAGITMMPTAVILMFSELWLLEKITSVENDKIEHSKISH